MTRVGIVVHPARPAAVDAAGRLIGWLREHGVTTVRVGDEPVGSDETAPPERFAKGLDLVVSVGGDGTFLRAAHMAAADGCPVLGVKVGRMGFLTEVDPEGAPALLQRVLDGSAVIEERLAVSAEPVGGDWFEPQWALNEVMVEKHARHRLVRLAVYVDGSYVTTFSADGVIVATPTGSTAYSFSARGPIVTPSVPCLLLTPIAAHMVFDRSFVLADDQDVLLEVQGEEAGLLTADGRESQELPVGSKVRIRKAANPARLVRPEGAPEFPLLVREKFDLPGDPGDVSTEG